jgi:hypothetical protein
MSVVYGVYDLMSRFVRVPVAGTGAADPTDCGLQPSPADADAFRELSRTVAGSEYARELLDAS